MSDTDFEPENITIDAIKAEPELNVIATVSQEDYSSFMMDKLTSLAFFEADEDWPLYIYCMDEGLGAVLNSADENLKEDSWSFTELQYNIKLNDKAADYYKFENYVENTLHYYFDSYSDIKVYANAIGIVEFVPYAIVLLLLIIYFINSINTQHSQLLLREGEFAVLRTIGMSKKQLKRMLMIEGMSGVTIATVLSILVGYFGGNLLGRGLYYINCFLADDLVYPKFIIVWPAAAVLVVMMLILGFIAASIGCRNKKDYI